MVRCAFTAAALCSLTLLACGPSERDGGSDGTDTADDGGGSGVPDSGVIPDPVVMKCNKMDLVFVVDDSASMDAEQSNLATNFPAFASLLSSYTTGDGDPIDYRIAVTTTGKNFTMTVGGIPITEHGPNGAFQNNCGLTKRWLEPSDPDMATTLACRANVGVNGSGTEMPLLMTKNALAARIADGTNAGFLRPDALLAVVILTDEDDSSIVADSVTVSTSNPEPTPTFQPAELVSFLDQVKGNRTKWAAGVIAGPGPGQCTGSFGDAVEAKRLKTFVQLANARGSTQAVFSSICTGDLTGGLQTALDTFQAACEGIIQ